MLTRFRWSRELVTCDKPADDVLRYKQLVTARIDDRRMLFRIAFRSSASQTAALRCDACPCVRLSVTCQHCNPRDRPIYTDPEYFFPLSIRYSVIADGRRLCQSSWPHIFLMRTANCGVHIEAFSSPFLDKPRDARRSSCTGYHAATVRLPCCNEWLLATSQQMSL